MHPIGRRTLRVVVSAPNTSSAAIVAMSGGVTVTTTSAAFEILEFIDGTASRPLLGIEPTMSIDGRLMVFHSHPDNTLPTAADNESKLAHLMYSYNSVPGARTGWSRPKNLSQIHNDRNTMIAGVRLADRYPLAREPLTEADGTPFDPRDIRGAYPG